MKYTAEQVRDIQTVKTFKKALAYYVTAKPTLDRDTVVSLEKSLGDAAWHLNIPKDTLLGWTIEYSQGVV